VGALVDRDQEHLALLKLGFYIMAGFNGLCALFTLIYIGMGIFFAFGLPQATPPGLDPRFMGALLIGMGLTFFLLGIAATFLTYFAGRSLGERRRRIFCMVVAGVLCLSLPFGTMLGVCTIIVLNRPSVKELFEGKGAPPELPPLPLHPSLR
jgi:hypothetical protein